MIEKRFCIYSEAYGTSREKCGCVECSRILAEHVKQATPLPLDLSDLARDLRDIAKAIEVGWDSSNWRRPQIPAELRLIANKLDPPAAPHPVVDEEAEKGQAFERWLEALPKCISYEGGCDGDLVAMEHSDDCPMKGREPATLRDAFEAGAAVRTEAARAAKPIKLTLEQVNDALNHASEGRTNSVKPDLLANQINRLIVRASAPAKEGKE